ncbi:MAG TPA: S49 family peptidase [Herbaspirillum sp.]|nr:S49 family peptidase [Herbaspirillum sp.]
MSNNQSDNPEVPASGPAEPVFPPATAAGKGGWERDVLEKLLLFTVKEQRAHRRWSIFFKVAGLVVFVFAIWSVFNYNRSDIELVGRHTALVEISGVIDAEGRSSASAVMAALGKAFSATGSVGVILKINSPGGSPVQAGMINDEIMRLRKAYPKKPLYVVVEEVCASGGYYIAAAADRIYVNKASIVGSIGVLMDGFGFTGLMDKLGVERRLLTAGENKGFLDPFSPQDTRQKKFAQQMLGEVHQQFIDVVRKGRGQRLKETPEIFSGMFWIGSKAVTMGLADGFGTVDSVARDVIEAEDLVDYTQTEGLPERVLKKFGVAVGSGVVKSMLDGSGIALR